ncbi:MAG TPA: saccharopine dehydrogenase NADP-binding domain-containing protein, partial [Coriobacteriia bacterium]|nr:saccharopine dehydrogenase NADP-binding domain-containing protein [Coriobacteriia bacterium]
SNVEEIRLADLDEDLATSVAARWGAGKTTASKVDARDPTAVARFAHGADILVNAVLPEWVVPVMEAALDVVCHYLDMATRVPGGTVDDGYEAQMKLDQRFRDAGLTALITTGMTPGVTNSLAAIGYENLERCEAVRIRATSTFQSEIPVRLWSQETWFIDSQTPALCYTDGSFRRAEPFGGREYFDFPEPFGRRPVTHHEHEEVSTLPRWLPRLGEKGLRHVDFKMGASDASLDALKAVVDSGMASPIPRDVKGMLIRPIDVLVSNLPPNPSPDEIAELARAGRITDEGIYEIDLHENLGAPPAQTFLVYPPNMQAVTELVPGANRISYGTSVPAAIYGEYLLDGTITTRGVLPPEGLPRETRLAYVEALVARGFRIAHRTTKWL